MIYSLTDVLNESLPDLRSRHLKPVTVAVIDTGIDSSHEVLRKRVFGAWEFVEDNEIVEKRELPLRSNNDEAGHGTAVASIIAKIAPNAKILDFKVLSANFTGTGKIMMAGLKAAIDSDAKIINMSLACMAKYRNELAHLLEEAYQKHKIIIASKRNVPKEGDLGFPAELSSCISVENHSYDNNPFFIEHIDEQPIEFAAHGENILAAQNGGGYYRLTGTSFATPTVSGNTALLLGAYPDLELYEIKSVLKFHSQMKSYAKNDYLNPMEVAESTCRSTTVKQSGEYHCPHCYQSVRVHDAFVMVKCPRCHNIFQLLANLDKALCNEVMRQQMRNLPISCCYHNVKHTKEVIANTYFFMQHYSSISAKKKKCLLTAALLHDFGYTEQYEENEPVAAKYAAELLPGYGYSSSEIDLIRSLILATAMPVSPGTLLEKILCDADVAHIGTVQYWEKTKLLRKERENFDCKVTDEQWLEEEIAFLSQHKFHQSWLEQERSSIRNNAVCRLKRMKNKKNQCFVKKTVRNLVCGPLTISKQRQLT